MRDDDILDRMLAPPGTAGDPLDAALGNEQRSAAVVRIQQSRDANPEAAAKAARLARQNGLPASTVARNLKAFEQSEEARVWSEEMRRNPKLASWLNEPSNVEIAADDQPAISAVARAYDPKEWAKKHGSIYATRSADPTFWGGIKGIGRSFLEFVNQFDLSKSLDALDSPTAALIPQSAPGVPSINTPSARAARQRSTIRSIQQSQAREAAASPEYQSWLARNLYGAGVSGARMVPGIIASVATKSPTPALIAAGVGTALPAYGKYRARGASRELAQLASGGEGAVEVVTEKLPMGYLVEKFGKVGMGRFLAEYLARDMPGELAATMAQDAIDTAVANPDKTWGEYWDERPRALLDTAVQTLFLSALTAGSSSAGGRIVRQQGEAIDAEADAEFLDEIANQSAASKTRQRVPGAFASLLERLGGDVAENVYVPGEAVASYLQSDDAHDREFWEPYAGQIGEAAASGGDVVIPASEAMAHLSGTKAWEALKDDIRLTPGGMSLREAQAVEADYTAAIEREASEAAERVAREIEAQEPRRKLFESIYSKLANAGYTPDTARLQAEWVSSRYATRAARLGQELTGDEFDRVLVNQVLPEKLAPIVASGGLKMTIAAMRHGKGRKAKVGPSLVDWIIARGGIEDRGGDIASMGGAKLKGISAKGARKLIREHVDAGQGDMLGGTRSNANAPDVMFVDAIEAGYFPELLGRLNQGDTAADTVDVADFLAAIDAGIRRGEARYAVDTSADELREAADGLRQLLEQEGIDPEKASDREIAAFVQRYQEAASEGRGFDQAPPVGSEAFKRWFGDSKIVAANGEPLEVYHGTNNKFDAFSASTAGGKTGNLTASLGFFFSPSPEEGARYASDWGRDGGRVISAYLKIENPYRMSYKEFDDLAMQVFRGVPENDAAQKVVALRAKLKREGYDGIVINPGSPRREFVAFEPTQIKSVNNSGAFDPSDPRIMFQPAKGKGGDTDGLTTVEFGDFATGRPVTFDFVHNTESATGIYGKPKKGAPFGRYEEPSGRYVTQADDLGQIDTAGTKLITGQLTFVNPLVLDVENWKGELSAKYGKRGKALSKALIADGYDGVVTISRSDRPGRTHVSEILDLTTFDEAKALYQSFMDGPRGRVTFGNGKAIVDLFEKRDLSTFIHETGHIWLEEFWEDSARPDAPDQLKADRATVEAWFKANGHKVGKDGSIPVDAHELWARGVERFVMEGKAPSSALRRAFDAFRSWLLTIYQVVDNLRSPISPEIREVMARLIATDEEIAEAAAEQNVKALFTDAAQAGMTEAEFAAYRATTQEARSDAFDALLYRTMASVRAARTKEFREQEAAARAEVADNVASRREFVALAILRDKTNGVRLDRQWLLDTYGADALDLIPANVPPLYADNGTNADEIAERAGFETGDEMVRMLMGVEARRKEMRAAGDKRSVRDSVIDEETSAITADRYGDPLSDGSIEREARELIHNDRQGEVIASELRALSRRRPNLQPSPYQLAKRWAARKVAEGTVRDYTSRSAIQRFQRAARKAGAAAEAAMLAGNIDETFRQKQSQMLNNALVAEATKAADTVDAAVSRLSRIAKRRTIKSVDQDYLEQAQALLEQVELKARSQLSIDRQGKFEAWAREREAEGHDVVVPASFEASLGTTHYSRLSVEKLLGLDDAVGQIIHLGRFKQTLIDGKEQRDFDAVVKEAQDAAGRLPPKPPSDLYDPSWIDRFKSGVAGADAALLKMETVFDWLDGGKSDGVFNRIVFRPVAEAQDRENTMLHDYYGRIREAMAKVPQKTLARWTEKVSVPEMINRETGQPFAFTRQNLIAAALNMGNEGNVQRLVDGYGWNEASVRAALDRELTKEEWQFVQDVWDIFETLWPEIARMERAINGVAPDKVAAVPVDTRHGTFRGGYYPAIYDSRRDLSAEANAGKEGDKFGTLYTRATTRASSTKERAEAVKRPLLLQLGVINRHLGEVIHDITHREAVMQADKFLSSKRVMTAVDQTLGPEIRKQFQPWLKFVANSWAMERAGNEGMGKFINKARANATVVGMGWRVSTILTQLAGYSNSFEYVGERWVAEGIARTAANPIGTFNFVMEKSGEIRHRMDTLDRDIRLTINQMAGKHDVPANVKRFMFHGIGYADRMVVIPTWIGAYNKALAAGASDADAIYEADKAVRKSQGAGSPKDLAAVQRGTGKWGELLRIATMFYSYMSAFYQRERTLGRDISAAVRGRDIAASPRLIARAWWLIVVPPLLSELLAGRGPDDDEDWGEWSLQRIIGQVLGPIPFVRDLVNPIWDALSGGKPFDYQLSPLQSAGQSFVEVATDIGRAAQGKDTTNATKHALEATGYATGLVPGQMATATQFLVDVGEGEQDPRTLSDWYRGLTKGKVEEK